MIREKLKNSRMSKRVPVNVSASFTSGDFRAEGVVLQMSEGGMLFCCPGDIDVMSKGRFTLKLFANEDDLELDCEIIHRLYENDKAKDALIKYGVRFLDPDKSKKEVIDRVIRFATMRDRYFSKRPTDS